MLQFTPLDFFCQYKHQEEDSFSAEPPSIIKHDSSITGESSNQPSNQETMDSRHIFSTTSEEHNMIKHMFTTIKKMVGKHILDIGNHFTKPIILQVWKIFESTKNPSRKILKAMLDKKTPKKLIQNLGFKQVLDQFGLLKYQQAMQTLREEMVSIMRGQNLKKHFMERQMMRKQRLIAYGQYLIEFQIKKGEILLRANEQSKKRISQIINMNRGEQECLDSYLA